MIKKVIFTLLTLVIVAEGVYLAKLTHELRELERTSPVSQDLSTLSPSSQANLTKSASTQTSLPTTKGIKDEIIKRLSEWHKKPIKKVIAECKKKLEKNPKDVDTHVKLGEIYVYFPEKHKEALEHFKEALAQAPEHPKKEYIEFWAVALQQPPAGSNITSQDQSASLPKSRFSSPTFPGNSHLAKPGNSIKDLLDSVKNNEPGEVIIVKEPPKMPLPQPEKVEVEIPKKRTEKPTDK